MHTHIPSHAQPFHEESLTTNNPNPLPKRRKPKLYKPFNLHGAKVPRAFLQVKNYASSQPTPAAGVKGGGVQVASGGVGRSEGYGVEVRGGGGGRSMARSATSTVVSSI